jgi:glutamate-5-semialdehyde dehydrogenase
MTAAVSRTEDMTDVNAYVTELGRRAAKAARTLAAASTEQKNTALTAAARRCAIRTAELLAANAKDVASVKAAGKPDAFIDRLILTEERIAGIADALDQIAALPDPVGRVLHTTERPNGLTIRAGRHAAGRDRDDL